MIFVLFAAHASGTRKTKSKPNGTHPRASSWLLTSYKWAWRRRV